MVPFPFPRGVWTFMVERSQSCPVPKVRRDGQPTHLARCLLGLSCLLYLPHDSALRPAPDQPEGGLTTRPLSPRCCSPSQSQAGTGQYWTMYTPLLARCVQAAASCIEWSGTSVQRIVLYSMYCTVRLRTWTLGAVLYPYHRVLYWSSMLRRNTRKRVQYPVYSTQKPGWSMLA